MIRILVLLLIIVPAIEIFLMIQVGQIIGGWPTFFLIVGMSFFGAYLLKVQGKQTLMQLRRELSMGIMPGETLLDGACLLVGGTLLLTPGFFTDALGLLLVLPGVRNIFKHFIKVWLMQQIQKGRFMTFRRF
jgi:UPF0716 protein FxsA